MYLFPYPHVSILGMAEGRGLSQSSSQERTDLVAYWSVPLLDGAHTVEFEHGTTSGKRVVRVDGKVGKNSNFPQGPKLIFFYFHATQYLLFMFKMNQSYLINLFIISKNLKSTNSSCYLLFYGCIFIIFLYIAYRK